MIQDFRDKVAFVAGASGGINFAVARHLARRGAKVGIVSRSAERIEAAAQSLRSEGFEALGAAADVRNYDQVETAVEAVKSAFGAVDIVVSGAAGNFLSPASELSANGFKTVVDIDLVGTFNVYRAALASLKTPGASLIAITAPQGSRPFAQQVHACAAKAGVNMLTRVLALEWGARGIRVNAISPGPIDGTEGVRRLWPDEASAKRLQAEVPLGRLGHVDDIAEAVAYLASPAAQYVTGTILDVDGGYLWGTQANSMRGAA
jgi:NAD(P)-dependent dehydrogenase (short-subunit alcohol dehydrogenase family)